MEEIVVKDFRFQQLHHLFIPCLTSSTSVQCGYDCIVFSNIYGLIIFPGKFNESPCLLSIPAADLAGTFMTSKDALQNTVDKIKQSSLTRTVMRLTSNVKKLSIISCPQRKSEYMITLTENGSLLVSELASLLATGPEAMPMFSYLKADANPINFCTTVSEDLNLHILLDSGSILSYSISLASGSSVSSNLFESTATRRATCMTSFVDSLIIGFDSAPHVCEFKSSRQDNVIVDDLEDAVLQLFSVPSDSLIVVSRSIDGPHLHLVNVASKMRDVIDDPTFADKSGPDFPTYYFSLLLGGVNSSMDYIGFLVSSTSPDVSVIGKRKAMERPQIWLLDRDEYMASLPLADDYHSSEDCEESDVLDTFCCGLALDFTNQIPVPRPLTDSSDSLLPASPLLWLINDKGWLLCFQLVNLDFSDSLPMTHLPEPLPVPPSKTQSASPSVEKTTTRIINVQEEQVSMPILPSPAEVSGISSVEFICTPQHSEFPLKASQPNVSSSSNNEQFGNISIGSSKSLLNDNEGNTSINQPTDTIKPTFPGDPEEFEEPEEPEEPGEVEIEEPENDVELPYDKNSPLYPLLISFDKEVRGISKLTSSYSEQVASFAVNQEPSLFVDVPIVDLPELSSLSSSLPEVVDTLLAIYHVKDCLSTKPDSSFKECSLTTERWIVRKKRSMALLLRSLQDKYAKLERKTGFIGSIHHTSKSDEPELVRWTKAVRSVDDQVDILHSQLDALNLKCEKTKKKKKSGRHSGFGLSFEDLAFSQQDLIRSKAETPPPHWAQKFSKDTSSVKSLHSSRESLPSSSIPNASSVHPEMAHLLSAKPVNTEAPRPVTSSFVDPVKKDLSKLSTSLLSKATSPPPLQGHPIHLPTPSSPITTKITSTPSKLAGPVSAKSFISQPPVFSFKESVIAPSPRTSSGAVPALDTQVLPNKPPITDVDLASKESMKSNYGSSFPIIPAQTSGFSFGSIAKATVDVSVSAEKLQVPSFSFDKKIESSKTPLSQPSMPLQVRDSVLCRKEPQSVAASATEVSGKPVALSLPSNNQGKLAESPKSLPNFDAEKTAEVASTSTLNKPLELFGSMTFGTASGTEPLTKDLPKNIFSNVKEAVPLSTVPASAPTNPSTLQGMVQSPPSTKSTEPLAVSSSPFTFPLASSSSSSNPFAIPASSTSSNPFAASPGTTLENPFAQSKPFSVGSAFGTISGNSAAPTFGAPSFPSVGPTFGAPSLPGGPSFGVTTDISSSTTSSFGATTTFTPINAFGSASGKISGGFAQFSGPSSSGTSGFGAIAEKSATSSSSSSLATPKASFTKFRD